MCPKVDFYVARPRQCTKCVRPSHTEKFCRSTRSRSLKYLKITGNVNAFKPSVNHASLPNAPDPSYIKWPEPQKLQVAFNTTVGEAAKKPPNFFINLNREESLDENFPVLSIRRPPGS